MLYWKRIAERRTGQWSLPVDATEIQRRRCIWRGPGGILGRRKRCGTRMIGHGCSRSRRRGRFSRVARKAEAHVDRFEGGHRRDVWNLLERDT